MEQEQDGSQQHFQKKLEESPSIYYTVGVFFAQGSYIANGGGFSNARTVGNCWLIIFNAWNILFTVLVGHITAPVSAGVYVYGNQLSFPSSSYNNAEYYVTPLFVPN